MACFTCTYGDYGNCPRVPWNIQVNQCASNLLNTVIGALKFCLLKGILQSRMLQKNWNFALVSSQMLLEGYFLFFKIDFSFLFLSSPVSVHRSSCLFLFHACSNYTRFACFPFYCCYSASVFPNFVNFQVGKCGFQLPGFPSQLGENLESWSSHITQFGELGNINVHDQRWRLGAENLFSWDIKASLELIFLYLNEETKWPREGKKAAGAGVISDFPLASPFSFSCGNLGVLEISLPPLPSFLAFRQVSRSFWVGEGAKHCETGWQTDMDCWKWRSCGHSSSQSHWSSHNVLKFHSLGSHGSHILYTFCKPI